jgi:flagellar hook protein FlgE
MTISSSLNASVSGLNVNASRLATISDNIANSSTFGYKRAVADFHSLVADQSKGSFSAGGVRVTTGRMIDQRGSLITTNNATDLAVSGRGMIPVTSSVDAASDAPEMRLTSTGSFRRDESGVLRTDSGLVLLGWPAAKDGTIPAFPRDTARGLEAVRIDTTTYAADPTTQIKLGVNLPAVDTNAGASGEPRELTLDYFGNLGQTERLDMKFSPVIPASGTSHTWRLEVRDQGQGGILVGEFEILFDSDGDDAGTVETVTPMSAGTYDTSTGKITIGTINGDITLDVLGSEGAKGLSQLSDIFAPLSVTKNGSPVGNLASIEVDEKGILSARYDTGFSKALYQIPIVDVPNINGLQALPNQTYAVSGDSGAFYLWDAGQGPVGAMVGFAREESTTDVAGELTQLIQTQRAYSSNAKVIQTVDEMLQETTNIKR